MSYRRHFVIFHCHCDDVEANDTGYNEVEVLARDHFVDDQPRRWERGVIGRLPQFCKMAHILKFKSELPQVAFVAWLWCEVLRNVSLRGYERTSADGSRWVDDHQGWIRHIITKGAHARKTRTRSTMRNASVSYTHLTLPTILLV